MGSQLAIAAVPHTMTRAPRLIRVMTLSVIAPAVLSK
jgi:hypothetical protein